VGRSELIANIKSHPLNRAVRVDKMTVAALEATLELYRDGRADQIPARRLLSQSAADLRARAERLSVLLREAGVPCTVERTVGQVGGGAMPLSAPISYVCAIRSPSPQAFQEALRGAAPPIVARVSEDRVLLDVRCLEDEDLELVAEGVASAT